MTDNKPVNTQPESDEMDLGQLFQMIGRGFERLFRGFLRIFLYLKKKFLKLAILAVIGLAIGYGLNQLIRTKLKTEVIVRPNLDSKNYLYDVVDEIQSNILARDTSFFAKRGIDISNLQGFEITVEPVGDNNAEENTDEQLKYLELLQKFENDDLVKDVFRTEILNKSTLNHRITFFYKNTSLGNQYAEKLMEYINSNKYYNDLVKLNKENAEEKIKQNQNLIAQIDVLVTNYSEKMTKSQQMDMGRIVFDSENKIDITGLLELKNNLTRDIERKKLEMLVQKEPVLVLNFGNNQEVQKSFIAKKVVLIPLILMALFFLVDFVKYMNRKAGEVNL